MASKYPTDQEERIGDFGRTQQHEEQKSAGYVAFILNTEFDNGASTRLNADQPWDKERGIDKEKDYFKTVFVRKLGLEWINEDKFENLTLTDWDRGTNHAPGDHQCPEDDQCLRCKILSKDYSSCNYFVLVVSTHGREEQEPKLLMSDGKTLLLSKITDALRDKKLANVAKILILQACRIDKSVLDQCIDDLKHRIGPDLWRKFGAKMDISRADLEKFQRDYRDNVPKCIENILKPWRKSMWESYSREGVRDLTKALKKTGLVDLALEMKDRLSRPWDSGARIPGLLDQCVNYLNTRIGPEQWRPLGAKLGISPADLEKLQQEYPDNVPACINAILTSWRDSIYENCSVIRDLSKALKDVGLVELARETRDRLPKRGGRDAGVQGLLDQCVDDIKTRIGPEQWRPLGAKLGIRPTDLEKLQREYPDNVPACIVGISTLWRDSIYVKGISNLSKALEEVGLVELAMETKDRFTKRGDSGARIPVDGAKNSETGTARGDEETDADPSSYDEETSTDPSSDDEETSTDPSSDEEETDLKVPMLRLQEPPPTFLIVYSTTKGRYSYCSNTKGSWMLNCIDQAIQDHDIEKNPKLDFLTFLSKCNLLMSEKETIRADKKKYKCTMCISHRLIKVPVFDLKIAEGQQIPEPEPFNIP